MRANPIAGNPHWVKIGWKSNAKSRLTISLTSFGMYLYAGLFISTPPETMLLFVFYLGCTVDSVKEDTIIWTVDQLFLIERPKFATNRETKAHCCSIE
jgi:hypothetical protein